MSSNSIKLSVLDQSIVRKGGTAAQAIAETVATAQLAEKLGYSRFWVSEHHNSTMIAGSAPEILMVRLADATSHIRIGSGGIMLPNHSALKVAENFRMLEALFPGRIDLGIGRAPGSDRITSAILNPSNSFSEEGYITQLRHLQAYFRDEAGTSYGPLLAVPQVTSTPAQWILSSSTGSSSSIAAALGLGLVIARFINGHAGPELAGQYRRDFRLSDVLAEPKVLLAIGVLCAETEEKAAQLRHLNNYQLLQLERGNFGPVEDYETVARLEFTDEERARIAARGKRVVSGTPESVKQQLTTLAREFEADEIIVTTMTYAQADRIRSFELLAEAFELERGPGIKA